ncbi:hypothetical protein, partial [Streptomyces sp. NPDC004721]
MHSARTTVRPANLLAAAMMQVCSSRVFVAQADDSGHTVTLCVKGQTQVEVSARNRSAYQADLAVKTSY